MCSTFMGLETNRRGLMAQQSALYTTGHNLSNANTLGYSRQRVNMQATEGFPGGGLSAGTMPGFLGTGVEAGSIQRVRDSFVDQQFRQESHKLGYWESRTSAISQMEDVLNEPSDYGLSKNLSQFWKSLQDLAVNPENGGARAVAVNQGVAVSESFNHINRSLMEIQTNLGKEIDFAADEVNSILTQIAGLNKQISDVEPNGYLPNDLYDARDVLLDQLSTFFPIETSYDESGGRASALAEGSVTVSMKMKDGSTIELVNKTTTATLSTNPASLVEVATDGTVTNKPVIGFTIQTADGQTVTPSHTEFHASGKLSSLMNSYGTADGKGLYPEMLAELDKMAAAFIEEFNAIHAQGEPLPTDPPNVKQDNFFTGNSASTIGVNQSIVDDPGLLNASDSVGEEGNGKNAKALGEVQFKGLGSLEGATIESFYQGVIGKLGVQGREADRLTFNTATLLMAVDNRRASVSSVSLDEEMTNMIKFQHAYNASARMITVTDETLDKIINGMGRVGM